jgi:hypothetical protein
LDLFLRSEAGSDFQSLLGLFPAAWKPVVMGGLLRDLLSQEILRVARAPADVDIVIFGAASISQVRDILETAIRSTNAFGGFKCQLRPHGIVFDLWRVEDHTNMAAAPCPHTIEQLLQHNLLDIDALLWDPATNILHDCGCQAAIQSERIDMMGPEGISRQFLAAQLAHVLVIAYKTNFSLSDKVREFIADASAKCPPLEIEQTLHRKHPQTASKIELFWNDLLAGGTPRCPDPTRAASL